MAKHDLVAPDVDASECYSSTLQEFNQCLAPLGSAVVVHEDMLTHGELHDSNSLSCVTAQTGVLEVEANKFVLLLL
jgi:hypothetical protein